MTSPAILVAHCRAGFEPEAAADLARVAAGAKATLAVDAPVGRGFVVATPTPFDAQRFPGALANAPPIFVRSLFFGTGTACAVRSGEPDEVAAAVLHGLFDAKPKPRYLVVPNQEEAQQTIDEAIRELIELNERQPYSYSRSN